MSEEFYRRQEEAIRNLKKCGTLQLVDGVNPRVPLPCDTDNLESWMGDESCRKCPVHNTPQCRDPDEEEE